MKFLRLIFVASLIFIVAAVCFSQTKQEKEPDKKRQEKSVDLVEVKANVLVSDASGKQPDDVKVEDIKVYEDGVEQKITYFARKEPIMNLGLVMDNTGSMREKLNEVIFAGSTVIADLAQNDEAFVIRFVSSENIEIVQDWTSDKRKLNAATENLYVEGGQTAIIDALYLAAQKLAEREKSNKSKRYALILISDCVDKNSYYNLAQLLEQFKNTDLQIFSFSFPVEDEFKLAKKTRVEVLGKNGKNPILLNDVLALKTGGTAYTLNKKYTKEDIAGALKKIAVELRSQYVVGYTSTNQNHNGIPRKLTVKIADGAKGEKRQGITRESFNVPKD